MPLRTILTAVLLLFVPTLMSADIPRKISYQGYLTSTGGAPVADGTYQLSFTLYDTGAGGSALWGETHPSVQVESGVFHAILGSINPIELPFDRSYYLEVTIQGGPGISGAEVISPRSELTSSPYAIRSDSAQYAIPGGAAGGDLTGNYPDPGVANDAITGAKILDGTIQAADIGSGQLVKSVNGLKDNILIGGSGGATVTSSGDSIIISAGAGGGGTGIQGVQNTNGTLDIVNPNGPTATINLKNGGVTTAQIADNAVTPAKINPGGATGGQALVFNGSTVGWGNSAGTLALPFNDSGATTGSVFTVRNVGGGGGIWAEGAKDAVVGNSSGAAKSGVWGNNSAGGTGVAGSTNGANPAAGVWGSNSSNGIGVRGTSSGGYGVYGESTTGHAVGGYSAGTGNAVNGWAIGAGAALGALHTGPGNAVYGIMTGTGRAGYFQVTNAANSTPGVLATHAGSGSAFSAVNSGTGYAGVFSISNPSSASAALYVSTAGTGLAAQFNGDVALNVLQINGGSDVAEPFEVEETGDGLPEPGTVMALDPVHPGRVLVSATAYDQKVAGIVSGAGGVKAGLTLKQQRTLDGNALLAIAGRVYCRAEALKAPIGVGDLLTTSDIPGLAMKATDRERGQGAVIGKAMSALESGTGLVLVLVNLQ
jgi:hypothetical protein